MESSDHVSAVTVMPTSWAALPYMSDTKPLNDSDMPCIRELRDVLAKHGMLDRFGITLIHKHFEIEDQEILVETIDFENRALRTTPMSKSVIGECIETSWSLSTDDARIACYQSHCHSTCVKQEKLYKEMLKG